MREKNLILVVDDSRTVLHGTCRILQKAGYETIEASSGMEGLRLTIEHKPDLVLLDVVLPDIYGYEVCRRIKAESDLAGTLVILISSLDTHEDHETHGLEIGADGYIARPVSNNNLLAHIKSLLRLKAAEDRLRQSEMKFRTVADFTYDWEYWIAPDGVILYMSPSSERITGYQRDEFLNNPELLRDIIHKDDRDIATDHLDKSEASTVHIVTFRIITRHGIERWIAHQCQPIFDDGGKFLGRRVSNRDITDRKRAEEELTRSEARLRSYFQFPIVGMAITSLDKSWLEVNSALCDMLGYSQQEMRGMTWSQLTHPDDMDADVAQFSRVLAGEIDTYAMEKRFIHKNGQIIWTALSVSCVRKPDGSLDYTMALLQDITERKRAEETAWRLAFIVESSDDAIISKTLDGTITSWNGGAERLYGYSAKEIIGQPISILLPPEILDDLPDILTRISRGEVVRHFETKRRTKDGRIVDVSLTISPIKTREGKIIGASSTARDITERKLLEKERQKVFVELQKALSEVKKLSGFLPICSSCKKIRDDKGYWKEVERYIGEHSEAEFSHSICPECMRKLYPEYADEVLRDLEKNEKK
jgi:PAS domain S-box-containing protein